MNVKEKLVELLQNAKAAMKSENLSCDIARNMFVVDFMMANGVTVQEWISVYDRLPEESGMYIVTANDGHAQRVSFVQWQKKNRMWNLTGARSYWRVTHWMPLPKPPKGAYK